MSQVDILYESSQEPIKKYENKICEFCSKIFVREIPASAKHGAKLCKACAGRPVLNQEYWNKINAVELFEDENPKRQKAKRESKYQQAMSFINSHPDLKEAMQETKGDEITEKRKSFKTLVKKHAAFKMLSIFIVLITFISYSQAGTISGKITTATNGNLSNGTLSFQLSNAAVVSGTASIVTNQVSCYTDNSGNVVGAADPVAAPTTPIGQPGGSLTASTTYFVKVSFLQNGLETNASPEISVALTSSQNSFLVSPAGVLGGAGNSATNWRLYVSTSSGNETLQFTSANGIFTPITFSGPLVAGSALPSSNATTCSLRFSDELIPTGTYYRVNLTNKNGSQVSGYPQNWCTFGGSNGTINVSNGTPLGICNNGVVYPQAITTTSTAGFQFYTGLLKFDNNGGIQFLNNSLTTYLNGVTHDVNDRIFIGDQKGIKTNQIFLANPLGCSTAGGGTVNICNGNSGSSIITPGRLVISEGTPNGQSNTALHYLAGSSPDCGPVTAPQAVTGTTNETTLYSCALQVNALLAGGTSGANGAPSSCVDIKFAYQKSANGNNYTIKVYLNGSGVAFDSFTLADNNANMFEYVICNNASLQTAQTIMRTSLGGGAVGGPTFLADTQNTANALTLKVTATLAVGTDTITGKYFYPVFN